MLHLILPAPLHRTLLRYAHAVRVVWWRWAKPRTIDCRVIALDPDGRVLLVRHSYGPSLWVPPGGRPEGGESAIEAARRELREEVGCDLRHAFELMHPDPTSRRVRYVVVGEAIGVPKPDGREITALQFFPLHALPSSVAPQLGAQLRGWITEYRSLSDSTA